MRLIELLPYGPWIIITKVKNKQEAEEISRNEGQWIILTDKQYLKFRKELKRCQR